MKMVQSREEITKNLQNRHKESYNSKDDSGKFGSIFKSGLPPGFNLWKCSEGEHIIDIIPFLTSSLNPNVTNPGIDWAYWLDVWTHGRIGPTEDAWLCNTRTLKSQKCPVCEFQMELRKIMALDEIKNDKVLATRLEAEIKSYNPSRRGIYNIHVLDTPAEEAKGIQVWEVAHWFMEKYLAELSKIPRGGGYIYFADPDTGKTICFKRQGSGGTNTTYLGHRLMDRQQPIENELIEQTWALSDHIKWPEYEEVFEAFFGLPYDKQSMPEMITMVHPDLAQFVTGAEVRTTAADVGLKIAEKPKPESAPAKTETVVPAETAAEPAETVVPAAEPDIEVAEAVDVYFASDNPCPEGKVWGADLDKFPECNGCPKWDDCADKADKLLEESKTQKPQLKTRPK
jgi:hypothetical protein